ncbi:MAG: hypothetical protein QN163_04160 [Armatimonadota bacterium]|nr:hypothetical protein [Armatimonadota bacterium]MDR5697780.1 hypothetical protein [Armatimonadota bacterium]
MRYVGDQVAPHPFHLLQRAGHAIELGCQASQLVAGGDRDAFVVATAGDALAGAGHRLDRRHDAPRQEARDGDSDRNCRSGRDRDGCVHGPQEAAEKIFGHRRGAPHVLSHHRQVVPERHGCDRLGRHPQHDRADADDQ